MSDRQKAILVVLITTREFRWHAGAITADGLAVPLLRSDQANLHHYTELESDEQVSFLRHRLAGVLQRGCDRLFARHMKANHFLLIADGRFVEADPAITQRLADHFVQWMINPPITYIIANPDFEIHSADQIKVIAGTCLPEVTTVLQTGLPGLVKQIATPESWELITRPKNPDS